MENGRYSLSSILGLSCAFILLLSLFPINIVAQNHPDLYFLTGFSYNEWGSIMGPNYSITNNRNYNFDPSEPLWITEIHRVYSHYDSQGFTHIDTTYAFDGYAEYHPDHVVVHFPGESNSINTAYRISKIRNDGYYLEDSYSNDAWTENPQISIHYYYNDGMRLIRKIREELSPHKYWNFEYTVDDQGRRVDEVVTCSWDSLYWFTQYRKQYVYSGEQILTQINSPHEFEKYSAYIPNTYNNLMPYLNDNWKIQSVIKTSFSNGIWGTPQIVPYEMVFGDDYVFLEFTNWAFSYLWENNGLPREIFLDAEDPSIRTVFTYSNTLGTPVPQEEVPEVIRCRIYPNPVKDVSKLSFSLPGATPIQVKTFNLRGQMVKHEMFDYRPAGNKEFDWEAIDSDGKHLSNGVYILQIIMGKKIETSRIMVIH